ncbi:succinylglutamate desuccinylase/aspartoacylase family protein [Hirschia litorea]|uniref:Succinylglutamate desuccinylase/aspartoacylase family protein n=1 Tax=Hirschia litorea TaxID=1199156 RepID=A0ABW2IQJ6_9PROT
MSDSNFEIGGTQIRAGERKTIDIPLSYLSDHTQMHMRVQVIRGSKPGPTLFVSGAIHGDEIIGVEIIRRIAELAQLKRLHGTVILVPIVNTYGFVGLSRYLPDRRDLNRSFPGSEKGALAAQLAHTFMSQIVQCSDYGLDLHSGAIHRANLPQIRANLDDPVVEGMAKAFGASIMLNANLRDGSLREAAQTVGCNMLLYEAGEALRFDESAIRIGVKGVIGVLRHLEMLPKKASKTNDKSTDPIRAQSSHWLRAPMGGLLRPLKALGDSVQKGEVIAIVSNPMGEMSKDLTARHSGMVIGRSNLPVVNRGDAIFHIARVDNVEDAEDTLSAVEMNAENDPLFDGMEIV